MLRYFARTDSNFFTAGNTMETKHLIFAAVLAGAGFLFWKNMNEAKAAELDFEEDDLLGFEEDEFLPSGAAPELTLLPGGLDTTAIEQELAPEFAPLGPATVGTSPGGLSPELAPTRGVTRSRTTGIVGAPPVTGGSAGPTKKELALIAIMEKRRRARGNLNPLSRSEKTAVIYRLRQKRRQQVAAAVRGKVATKKAKIKAKAKSRRGARQDRRSARREAVVEFITR